MYVISSSSSSSKKSFLPLSYSTRHRLHSSFALIPTTFVLRGRFCSTYINHRSIMYVSTMDVPSIHTVCVFSSIHLQFFHSFHPFANTFVTFFSLTFATTDEVRRGRVSQVREKERKHTQRDVCIHISIHSTFDCSHFSLFNSLSHFINLFSCTSLCYIVNICGGGDEGKGWWFSAKFIDFSYFLCMCGGERKAFTRCLNFISFDSLNMININKT